MQALYATFCPLFIFRLQGTCWEKHWDERKDNVYFMLWGKSVHYFFTLRSSGQLCPVFPRPKKLSSVPRGHQGDSPDFFLMSWSNKNKAYATMRLFNSLFTKHLKIIIFKIYKRKKKRLYTYLLHIFLKFQPTCNRLRDLFYFLHWFGILHVKEFHSKLTKRNCQML